jgi:hypothetical protein
MFVLSSTLTVFDRHGNSDEMPLDELFFGDDSSVPRGILRALNIEAAIKEIESAATGFRVLKINLIAHGGYHDVWLHSLIYALTNLSRLGLRRRSR